MTYKGTEIEKPTIAMIEHYIKKRGYRLLSGRVYSYWNIKHWYREGYECFSSLEEAVDTFVKMFPAKKIRIKKKQQKNVKIKVKKHTCLTHKPDKNKEHIHIDYHNQLKDKRWYDFREKVFAIKGRFCEKCGSTISIQIHHPKYKSGRYAWEYDPSHMAVLCSRCHAKEHGIDVRE